MRKNGKTLICPECGKSFYRKLSEINSGRGKYCSQKCAHIKRIGIPNYSNPDKGHTKTFNCETCGKEKTQGWAVYNKAKHHFCGQKCLGVYHGKVTRGVNHPRWTHGKYSEDKRLREQPAYQEWRKLVYKRDGWTCQDCGKKVRDIVAHHIFTFSEFPALRYETDNGITLCRACHKIRHSEIGIKTRFKTQSINLQESKI